MKLTILVSLFLLSLNSFYFYEYSSSLLSIGGYLIFFVLCLYCFLKNGFRVLNKIDCMFITYMALIIFFDYIMYGNLTRLFSITSILFIFTININKIKDHVQDTFSKITIIHLSAFYLQFLLFYIFNIQIDYIYPITGEEQRVFDGSRLLMGLNLIRPSGLYIEPSTYASYMMCMMLVLNDKYASIKKIALFSLFLSLSTLGFIIGFLYMLLNMKNFGLKSKIILYLVLGISLYYVVDRLFISSAEDYDVFGIRLEMMHAVLSWSSLFGHGMSAITNEMIDGLNVYDAGSGLSFIYFLGVIGYILFMCFTSNGEMNKFKKGILLSITKVQIFHPFFWLMSIFIKDN